jgi:sugar O-acyltransferase (sialic acid O-acetyltransferase NeuD family)
MKKKCVILGAGGHTRVLLDCLHLTSDVEVVGILDPNPELTGKSLFEVPILGDDSLLPNAKIRGAEFFAVGVGGAGNNRPRKELFELALKHDLKPLTIRHPTAIISVRALIGEGCQFLPGCIVNAGAELGSNIIINSGAIVEHDCVIGDHVHVATGAKLTSAVHVGNGAHVGAGATIRQGIQIGEYAVIGAGAAVVKNVSANVTVVGVPAKRIKKAV